MFKISPKYVKIFAQFVMSLIIINGIVFHVFQLESQKLEDILMLIISISLIISTYLASNLNTEVD